MAAGAAGDLRDLDIAQGAERAAIILAQRGEPDVVHVHAEAHADRIGSDEVVDPPRLEHLDLGVRRARAEGAHHNRRAAALAADQLGDGVTLLAEKPTTAERRGWRVAFFGPI